MTSEELEELKSVNDIILGNKLIAVFDGYIYPYKKDVWKGGSCLKNVDLLSRVKFVTYEDVMRDKHINSESRPFESETGLHATKYGHIDLWDNIITLSTDSESVSHLLLGYNERFQAYHRSMDWLSSPIKKIEAIARYFSISTTRYENGDYDYVVETSYNIRIVSHRSKIDAIWEAVVEFIKKYNEDKGNI